MVKRLMRFLARYDFEIAALFAVPYILIFIPWFLEYTHDPAQPRLTLAEIIAGKHHRPALTEATRRD